jgi:glycosyltransferase involved in cell wall biosynthesis
VRLEGLRVGFVAGTLGKGGAERQLYYYLRALTRSGAHPHVWSLTRREAWEEPIRALGVPVEWIGRSPSRALRLAALSMSPQLRSVQLVQSQHFFTNLYAVAAARIAGRPEAGALRSDCTNEVAASGSLGGMSLRFPRRIVANSQRAIRRAIEMGVSPARLRYLPNVVDAEAYACQRPRRVGMPIRVLAVGRLGPEKRFDRFLRVLCLLAKRGVAFEARVIGEGVLRSVLEEKVREMGLGGSGNLFPGPSEEMRSEYEWADVLIQSSDHEGTPNVVLEAMASGLPVVATAAGDTAYICPDGVAGFVREPADEEGLARSVEMLASNPELRARMGEAAAANVRERFSVERLPSLLENLYLEMGVLS